MIKFAATVIESMTLSVTWKSHKNIYNQIIIDKYELIYLLINELDRLL